MDLSKENNRRPELPAFMQVRAHTVRPPRLACDLDTLRIALHRRTLQQRPHSPAILKRISQNVHTVLHRWERYLFTIFLDHTDQGNKPPATLEQVAPLLKAFAFVQELISQKTQEHPYQSGISLYQRQTRHYDDFFALCAKERAKAVKDIANFQAGGTAAQKSTGTKASRPPRRAEKATAQQNP